MPTGQTCPACIQEPMGNVICKPYKSCKQETRTRGTEFSMYFSNGEDCHVQSGKRRL